MPHYAAFDVSNSETAIHIIDETGATVWRGKRASDPEGLFLWFCQMLATVRDVDRVHLQLRGGIPMSEGVQAWFDGNGAIEEAGGVSFEITPASVAALEDLAAQMETIIRRRYDTKAYKYVEPRTASQSTEHEL